MNWGDIMVKRTLIKGKAVPKIFECKLCGCVFSSDLDGCYWIDDVLSSDCPNCQQRSTLANLNTYENKSEILNLANMTNEEFRNYSSNGLIYSTVGYCDFPPPKKKWTDKSLKKNRNE